ncbi:HD-GYP domain-containing protein [Pseudodesulfovibrio pelocollis]|uniref:HD-GYP domain-containing protein n=1 Tax=Pseudodesulfovibrio pelocollis TaxID=3051432 RepID=UPI00255B0D8C|nr:HD domain-containing phosphohydrolase [Pseudodesulfovibrio sp. SB368]
MYNYEILGAAGQSCIRDAKEKLDVCAKLEIDLHSIRVGNLCSFIGKIQGFSESQCNRLQWAGFFHDLGKYFLAPDILFKKEYLSAQEKATIQNHAVIGAKKYMHFATSVGCYFDREVFCSILQHHERFDGHGYPSGMPGRALDLSSQIISLCDYVEALSADRCYRSAFPAEKVAEMVECEAGRAWPLSVADLFLKNQKECFNVLQAPLDHRRIS